jgi:diguanylate cyclase (GGDEF)-like protein
MQYWPDMFERVAPVREMLGDAIGEALLVFDRASGVVTFATHAAAVLFGFDGEELGERRAADLLAEFASPRPGEFKTQLLTPEGEYDLAVRLEELHAAPGAPGDAMVAMLRVLEATPSRPTTGRRAQGRAKGERRERLGTLWNLVVRRGPLGDGGHGGHVRAILRESALGLGLTDATLARVEEEELVVAFATAEGEGGTRLRREGAAAQAALLGSGNFAAPDVGDPRLFAVGKRLVRAYLCQAFRVGDTRWVLTFTSERPRRQPFDEDDWHYVGLVVEALSRALERRERDLRVELLASSDPLTSLPNRAAVHARLDEAIAQAQRLGGRAAVMFVDLDGFKAVNDKAGHGGGDVVLAEIAQRLRSRLRRSEYLGRLGGDEFAVVMPLVDDREEIEAAAHRIADVLTAPFRVDLERFTLSASIGVAIYPDDAPERDQLLAAADSAMYVAKRGGGARVRFCGDVDEAAELPAVADRAGSEPAQKRAPGGEAHLLFYQPIVDVRSGAMLAAEALIRRVHPVHGLLAPERAWSFAGNPDASRAFDLWLLRETAMQARVLQRSSLPANIDVSLACTDPNALGAVLEDDLLAGDVRRLRIEIAAAQLAELDEGDALPAFLESCAERGLHFALAGFDGTVGTLAALAHLPIQAVKLDRKLTEEVALSRTARAVVEGAVVAAKALGWSVIATGVESGAQQEAFAALGCDGVQGFYVAHPMTAVDFGMWVHERYLMGR